MDKKKYREAFETINVSNSLETRILNSTIYREMPIRKVLKFSYLVLIFMMTCVVSISIVYAKEIKELVSAWSSSIVLHDGTKIKIADYMTFVKIKKTAIKTNEPDSMLPMNYDKLEEMLGIKVLRSNLSTSSIIGYYSSLNNDGTIGRIDLWQGDFIRYDDSKYISMSISFLNENADKKYIMAFEEGLDATSGKINQSKFHINSLNLDAIVYENEWDNQRLTATFLYNNMIYNIIGNNITRSEMNNVLDSLK